MKTAADQIQIEIYKISKRYDPDFPYEEGKELSDEALYDFDDIIQDATDEFRCSGEPSGIKSTQFSRHYECEEVAKVLSDGTAIGWTYWYGGGKHGEPQSIDWIDDAYFVDVKQETRIVNIFTKK